MSDKDDLYTFKTFVFMDILPPETMNQITAALNDLNRRVKELERQIELAQEENTEPKGDRE